MKRIGIAILAATAWLSAWAAQPVNVNTASAEEIAENLKGIGASKAELIVEYRKSNGSFKHVDELINVKGIGMRTVDLNRGLIVISDDPVESRQ